MRLLVLPLLLIVALLSVDALSSSPVRVGLRVRVADKILSTIFGNKFLFNIAKNGARNKMFNQGLSINIDWNKNRLLLENEIESLTKNFDKIVNKDLINDYPSYYLKAFHAYDEGNLSWQAAMEVESAALTVHAPIFVKTKGLLDRNGDLTLRDNFHMNMLYMFNKMNFKPKKILDIGCSTGLSTLKLHETFPNAEIIGLDLSPYFLAVANYELQTKTDLFDARKYVSYLHCNGEDTTMGRGDVDMVSMCLISHELPESASRNVFQEAYDILPSGGVLSLMDMDPLSEDFKKFASNPFAFAAFKSTEPWIQEYVRMDLVQQLRKVGFEDIQVMPNSARHRTVVAVKR